MFENLQKIFIIAGVHGQEPQSSHVLEKLCVEFDNCDHDVFTVLKKVSSEKEILAIPRFNVYGLENNTRGNKNGVDLNRNLPAANWSKDHSNPQYQPGLEPGSELETQAFIKLLKEFKPDLIISIHTNHFVTVEHNPQVNFDGELESQGHKWAQDLSEQIDLELTCDIGYSTPGSLGSYAKDLKIPCITLEFDDKLGNEESFNRYSEALKKLLF